MNWHELHSAISVAREAANREHLRDASDGGSCNLDFAYLPATGIRESTARKHGYSIFRAGYHGRVMKLYSGAGQAELNTRMVNVFATKMRELGQPVGIYYQLD